MGARCRLDGTARRVGPRRNALGLATVSLLVFMLLFGGTFSQVGATGPRTPDEPVTITSIEIVFAEDETSPGIAVPAGLAVQLVDADGETLCTFTTDEDPAQTLADFEDECGDLPEGSEPTAVLISGDDTIGSVTGQVVDEGEVRRVVFTPVQQGGVLVAQLSFSESERSPAELDGPVEVTVPPGCGEGVVDDGTLVLYYDTNREECVETDAVTVGFGSPNGPEYRIAVPAASVEDGGVIDLDDAQQANGRGGAVAIDTGSPSGPWPAQRGLRIAFSSDGQECGTSDVNENGAYAVSLSAPCTDGSDAEVTMLETELVTSTSLGSAPELAIQFTSGDGQTVAMGRAQTDDDAALSEGETLVVSSGDQVCGQGQVQRDGAFLLVLPEACTSGGSLTATSSSDLVSSFSMPEDGSPTVNLVFTDPEPDGGDGADDGAVTQQRVKPLLESWQVIVIMGAILLITIVALLVKWDSNNRNRGIEKLIDAAAQNPGEYSIEEIRKLAEVHKSPNFSAAFDLALLAFVTVALVTLTLGGTVTEQGVLTILGAVVGYAAGRSVKS